MNKTKILLSFAAICAALVNTNATTVIPPTFDQLVSQAEMIVQTSVTDVRSQWVGEGAQRHIMTYVTFNIEEALKGKTGSTVTLQMLGGTVGDQTMEVTDTPKFAVGERDILFVEHNGTQFVPLVGIMNGRFHLQRDQVSGQDLVVTGEGRPLSNVAHLGMQQEELLAGANPAMTLDQFKAEIRSKLPNVSPTGRVTQ